MSQIQYLHIAFEVWGAVFCSIAAVIAQFTRHLDKRKSDLLVLLLLTEAVLDLAESLAYFYRGDTSQLGFIMVRATNFIVFVSGYCLALITFLYFQRLIENHGGFVSAKSKLLIKILFASSIGLLILSRAFNFYYDFDLSNRYYRLDSYYLMQGLGIAMLATILFETMKNRVHFGKIEFGAFITMTSSPIIGLIVQSFYYGASIYNLVNTTAILLLFVIHEMEYSRLMRDKELEGQLRMYQMQIKPHFIFNSLGVIRSLMIGKSESKEALDEFSRFLRGSLEMLTEDKLVSVSDELKTVKNYLLLQKRRFEEKLTVEMEIETENFEIPGFAIQTLVENAINHGIRRRADGSGRLKIKIYETETKYVIEVSDNGVGFDVKEIGSKSKGIGLKNLSERLKIMNSGELEIKSELGSGTLARAIIPRVK